jgi:hypothetical protein
VFAVVLGVAIAGVYGLAAAMQPPPVVSRGPIQVSLVVDGDTWRIEYLDVVTRNNTAFRLLLEASERRGFDVRWTEYAVPPGVFVTSINGTTNGQAQKAWQYWVNAAYGRVASDRQEIVDGDVVRWAFVVSQEGA